MEHRLGDNEIYLLALALIKPDTFSDSDDEVLQYSLTHSNFFRSYREEFDNKLEYKSQLDLGVYNEREKIADYFMELYRQYNDVVRNDLSGSKTTEFLNQLPMYAISKLFCINDLSFPWLADIFVQLLLFQGLNVISSAPAVAQFWNASSAPATGENTPSRSTPIDQSSCAAELKSRSNSVTTSNDVIPSTPPRRFSESSSLLLVQDQVKVSIVGSLNSSQPASAQHTYDKQKKLEERLGGSAGAIASGFGLSPFIETGIDSRKATEVKTTLTSKTVKSVKTATPTSTTTEQVITTSSVNYKKALQNIKPDAVVKSSELPSAIIKTSSNPWQVGSAIKQADAGNSSQKVAAACVASTSSGYKSTSKGPSKPSSTGKSAKVESYEQPIEDVFGGNCLFFFRFITITDSYKFCKHVEYVISGEIESIVNALKMTLLATGVEYAEESSTGSGSYAQYHYQHLFTNVGSPMRSDSLIDEMRDGLAESSLKTIASPPPSLLRSTSKFPMLNNQALTMSLMKLRLLGKFLGLLHFYPNWTAAGGSNNVNQRASNQISSQSPLFRLASDYNVKRDAFYRGKEMLPITAWLKYAKDNQQLLLVVPWVVEFLRVSKYDETMFVGSGSRYREAFVELLLLEKQLSLQLSKSAAPSAVTLYLLLSIREIYTICPVNYLKKILDEVSLVKVDPYLYVINSVDGSSNHIFGTTGFIRHLTPKLYEFVQIQRSMGQSKVKCDLKPSPISIPPASNTKRQIQPIMISPNKPVSMDTGTLASPVNKAAISTGNIPSSSAVLDVAKEEVVSANRMELFQHKLRNSFWNQHPAFDRLRLFIIDHFLQLGQLHMKEYVAHGVRLLWTNINNLHLDASISKPSTSTPFSPGIYQSQLQNCESNVDKQICIAKKLIEDMVVNEFLIKFLVSDAKVAVHSLCDMYLSSMKILTWNISENARRIQDQKLLEIAITLILRELNDAVHSKLVTFLKSYLHKKLMEVGQLVLLQFKRNNKVSADSNSTGTSVSSKITIGSNVVMPADCGCDTIDMFVKQRLLSLFSSELPFVNLWNQIINNGSEVIAITALNSDDAGLNSFISVCNSFTDLFKLIATGWSGTMDASIPCTSVQVTNWYYYVVNISSLFMLWLESYIKHSALAVTELRKRCIEISKLLYVLFPSLLYLDSISSHVNLDNSIVSEEVCYPSDIVIALMQVHKIRPDLLEPIVSLPMLVRVCNVSQKVNTIAFHENCAGLRFTHPTPAAEGKDEYECVNASFPLLLLRHIGRLMVFLRPKQCTLQLSALAMQPRLSLLELIEFVQLLQDAGLDPTHKELVHIAQNMLVMLQKSKNTVG